MFCGPLARLALLLLLCSTLAGIAWPALGAEIPVTDAAAIAKAMKTAAPGDVLVMRDGPWTDQAISLRGNGTASQPITLRAQTPGKVILNGTSHLQLAGQHLVVEGLWFDRATAAEDVIEFRTSSAAVATNCVLRHVAITDCSPAQPTKETKWISLYGVSNVVERCYLTGKRNKGTTLVVWVDPNRPNHHVIRSNHFGPRPALGANGGETIRVGSSTESPFNSRTLVEGNLFERCNGEVEVVSNKSCENVYRGNTFRECAGALTFRHGKRCLAEGNFFLGGDQPDTGGVRVIDADHVVVNNYFADLRGSSARSALTFMNGKKNSPLNGYFQVSNAVVAFNTFVDCENNFLIGKPDSGGKLAPVNCTIANNIVRSRSGPLVDVVTAPTNFVWQGNLFFGAKTGITVAGIETKDPQLQLGPDGLWRPAANSPARGTAVGEFPKLTADIDGQPRPLTGKDIGADQSSSEPARNRPLTAADVGPAWRR
jgi:poly(beta-D-mannuronate) lyase